MSSLDPTPLVRHDVFLSRLSSEATLDKITVRNLQVTVKAGVDAWGRKKAQPALITVSIILSTSFDSAAAADELDDSTVHYGHLAKRIKSAIEEQSDDPHLTTEELATSIGANSMLVPDASKIGGLEVDIFFPKASLLGEGSGYIASNIFQPLGESVRSRVMYLKNVTVPSLIGVNSNERLQKQPVVVNLWIEGLRNGRSDDYTALEEVVVKAIADSSFETLESLSTMVVNELRGKFFQKEDKGAYIRLRVEKPLAVPFADAPAIEILRPVAP